MTRDQVTLSDLRREIDRIDDALHDLLMRRADVGARVKEVKQDAGGPPFRPGREAQILRRLTARHSGALPAEVIVRIWRELISGFVGMQGPFAVAVWDQGDTGDGCWDLARDHFGTVVPMTRHQSTRGVLRAVADGSATVGVLPMPQEGESDPWWPALSGGTQARVKICAQLPFVRGERGWRDHPGALVIYNSDPEPSGDDRSLILIECDESSSRGRLVDALVASGLTPSFFAGGPGLDGRVGKPLYLVELDGFIEPEDERLDIFVENAPGVGAAYVVGAYAVPVDLSGAPAGETP
jgi:chorismate mutase-like protein